MREGWSYNFLGEISSINYGYTAKASFEADGPKFLRITDIQNGNVNWATVPSCSISEEDYDKHRLFENDIVFARTGATTGKSYLIGQTEDAVAASYLIRLRLECEDVLPAFVTWYFQTTNYWNAVTSGITGSTQGGFNASKLKNLTIPLPLLPEQRRIVAILDEAFQGIDRAVANTEKNLANARELFESYLDAAMAPNQSNAKIGKLGEVAGRVDTGPFGSLLHKSDYVEGGTPIINPANILDGEIVADPSKTIDQTAVNRLRSYILKDGDVIIGRRGEIGRCSAVTSNEAGWLCGTGCFVIRTNHNTHPSYLAHLLRCSFYKRKLEAAATGATMLNLSNKAISALQIELPSPDQQQTIVITLASVMERTKTLEQIYHSKIVSLAGLKQSILHKAFAGELTADRVLAEPVLAEAGA